MARVVMTTGAVFTGRNGKAGKRNDEEHRVGGNRIILAKIYSPIGLVAAVALARWGKMIGLWGGGYEIMA